MSNEEKGILVLFHCRSLLRDGCCVMKYRALAHRTLKVYTKLSLNDKSIILRKFNFANYFLHIAWLIFIYCKPAKYQLFSIKPNYNKI